LTADFDSQQYKDFLYELHCITCIDLLILDNLIKLQLIDFILVNPKAIQISSNGFFLNKYNIQLKENHTQLPEFIFASFPLYNPDFNVSLFKYMDKYIYYLANYNFDNPIFLDFKRCSFSNLIYIDVFLNIHLKYFFERHELLSEEEKEEFYSFINKRLQYGCNVQDFYLNSKKYFFKKNTSEFLVNHKHTDINKLIQLKENNFLNSLQFIKKFENTKINQLFERSLLRNQIINF